MLPFFTHNGDSGRGVGKARACHSGQLSTVSISFPLTRSRVNSHSLSHCSADSAGTVNTSC